MQAYDWLFNEITGTWMCRRSSGSNQVSVGFELLQKLRVRLATR